MCSLMFVFLLLSLCRLVNFYSLLKIQPFRNLFLDSSLPETHHPTQSELITSSFLTLGYELAMPPGTALRKRH